MKLSKINLLTILRAYNEATDDDSARLIDQTVETNPLLTNQLFQLRFNYKRYAILLDGDADDDLAYIRTQIATSGIDTPIDVLINPTSTVYTHSLAYKGKEIYLARFKEQKKRLDIVLSERYPDTSRNTWQQHVLAGHISVNGVVATASKQLIHDTDDIAIEAPDLSGRKELKLPIIYIDDDVIVIDKPAGVLVHAKGGIVNEFTVADFFRPYTTVSLDSDRPGIVHRLDRDTSGVMIGARTPEAYELLTKQFSERKVTKTYLAITGSSPKIPQARIDIPIGRNPSEPSRFRVDTKGKDAVTDYEVLASDSYHTLISLAPKTGRTHQLRVHLAHIGAPILGDRFYNKPSHADRLYLHAAKLIIETKPGSQKTFVAPTPAEFSAKFPNEKL
ncbi:MAG: RluA family pseudouridine synthase [Candidatus Saccharimonas sp.]